MKTEVKIQEVPKIQACHIHISALLICCGKRVDRFTYTMSMKNSAKKKIDTRCKTSSHYTLQVGMAHIWFCLILKLGQLLRENYVSFLFCSSKYKISYSKCT